MTAATPEIGPFRTVDAGRRLGISGDNLANYGNNTAKSTALVLDTIPVASTRPLMVKFITAVAAGGVTYAGAQIGDKVVGAIDITNDTDGAATFETTISVAGQIQQLAASTDKHIIVVVPQS